jgi:hypothetical protein
VLQDSEVEARDHVQGAREVTLALVRAELDGRTVDHDLAQVRQRREVRQGTAGAGREDTDAQLEMYLRPQTRLHST